MSKRILVLGGDMRIAMLANSLNQDGFCVTIYGFSDDIEFEGGMERAENLKKAVKGNDVVVAGLPLSADGENINMPFSEEKIKICELLKIMSKDQLLLGGRISDKIKDMCNVYNIKAADYFSREEMTVLNAIPTAEGAIEIAMNMLPVTIHGSNCLVLGFGRIGKVLAKDLQGLGANTFVEARRYDDLSWISAYGYQGIYLPNLKERLPLFDVIFNTVPYEIITEELIKYIRRDCPFIDLASMPGGINSDKAQQHGIEVVHALSLPGKTAPKTAGEIIKQTILNIFSDMGV